MGAPAFTYIFDRTPHDAALNMAIDEELLKAAAGPLLRVYRWAVPAVSFGYFGRSAEVRAAWPDRELVRRWTGGGVVPHGEDFTYTLIVPSRNSFAALAAAETYHRVHQLIARVLARTVAIDARLAPATAPKVSDACFANPAQHDILQGDEKLAGAAQRRTKFGLLHQGSIQLPDLPDLFREEFATALAAEFSLPLQQSDLPEAVLRHAELTSRTKYETPAWLDRF